MCVCCSPILVVASALTMAISMKRNVMKKFSSPVSSNGTSDTLWDQLLVVAKLSCFKFLKIRLLPFLKDKSRYYRCREQRS